jgi:hypothetical protein
MSKKTDARQGTLAFRAQTTGIMARFPAPEGRRS